MKLEYKILNKPKYRWTGKWIMSRRLYELINEPDIIINGKLYTLPKGFVWDAWTVPPLAIKLFDFIFDFIPPLFHDYFYKTAGIYPKITRKVADILLKDMAIDRGCKKREVYIAYFVIRIYSNHIWQRYKRHNLGSKELSKEQQSHINFNPHKRSKL